MSNIIEKIRLRFKKGKIPFLANDHVGHHLQPGEMALVEEEVAKRAQSLLEALLIDTENDHNTRETAKRMAKMYCREILHGRFRLSPMCTVFPNVKHLDEICVTGPITVRSICAHHFCPIVGKAWVGFIPGEKVIGLSKFNRIIDWICSRPQIQEEMVMQIADVLEKEIKPNALGVVLELSHSCMTWRGVKESTEATMTTSVMRGSFRSKPEARAEFLSLIRR